MTTVADIAKDALDAVSASITDAVLSATLDDGTSTYVGRMVLAGEKSASGFPMSTAKDRMQGALLEGFSEVAQAGWTVVAGGVTYFIAGIRDIAGAGGAVMANVISQSDMLWQTVTFQSKTRTPDGMGGYTDTWSDLATVSAGIIYTSGGEKYENMRVTADPAMQLIVQSVDDLTPECRAVIGAQEFNITFVNDFERRGYWDVVTLESGAS